MDGAASGGAPPISAGHRARVLTFLRRHVHDEELAEDLAQETLLRGFRNSDRLRDPRALDGWLLRIAYHVAMDWHRRGRRRLERQGVTVLDEESPVGATEPRQAEAADLLAQQRHWSRELRQALARLPCLDRVLLIAHYFVGLPCREIARRTGLSLANVKVRLHRARRRLRQDLPPADEFLAYVAGRERSSGRHPWPCQVTARLRHAPGGRARRQARRA